MKHSLRALIACAAATALAGAGAAAPAAASAQLGGQGGPGGSPPRVIAAPPVVLHVGQIDHQDVASRGGCEPDTLVEPDVAVSPVNAKIQVAVAHDCRFASGGAVDISYAWTHDGGAHWHHAPMPGLTKAVGGAWDRASDPVVTFGADGSVYVSALVFDNGCPTGVAVSRSTDGGATFGKPVLVQHSTTCAISDDKDWLVADTQPDSPFRGRLYQFWTEFLAKGGSPQVVRWSDNDGETWSSTHLLGPRGENAQDSQPVIEPDGAIVDVYEYSGGRKIGGGPNAAGHDAARPASAGSGIELVARTSTDGGVHWSARTVIARNVGGGPSGIRCCLALATGDPATGHLYAVWNAHGPGVLDPVELSSSATGRRWSRPVQVTPGHSTTTQYLNAAVAASHGRVYVTFGARDIASGRGNIVQQELTWSASGGTTFAAPMKLGPPSNLKYAAVAGGKFPGDYTGLSATPARVTAAWCVSSPPANPAAKYHQTLYAAVLRP